MTKSWIKDKNDKLFSDEKHIDVSQKKEKAGPFRRFLKWIENGAEKSSLREKSCPT